MAGFKAGIAGAASSVSAGVSTGVLNTQIYAQKMSLDSAEKTLEKYKKELEDAKEKKNKIPELDDKAVKDKEALDAKVVTDKASIDAKAVKDKEALDAKVVTDKASLDAKAVKDKEALDAKLLKEKEDIAKKLKDLPGKISTATEDRDNKKITLNSLEDKVKKDGRKRRHSKKRSKRHSKKHSKRRSNKH
jgi:hypothetical protein